MKTIKKKGQRVSVILLFPHGVSKYKRHKNGNQMDIILVRDIGKTKKIKGGGEKN